MHAYHVLDATCQITWRPFLLLFIIWTPHNSDAGVQATLSSPFGRHLPDYMASSLSVLSNLDAIRTITRRPILLPFSSWTPPTQSHGVRSAQLPRFGRLTLSHMASIPHIFSNLDVSHSVTWRPFLLLFPIWTPPTQSHSVRSAQLLQSGRLVSQHLASISITSKILDASHTHHWRPFRTSSPIWTPRQSTCGVQSTLSSPFRRHATFGRHATS